MIASCFDPCTFPASMRRMHSMPDLQLPPPALARLPSQEDVELADVLAGLDVDDNPHRAVWAIAVHVRRRDGLASLTRAVVIPVVYSSVEAAWADSQQMHIWSRLVGQWLDRHTDWDSCGAPYLWRQNWSGGSSAFALQGYAGEAPRFWLPSQHMYGTGQLAS